MLIKIISYEGEYHDDFDRWIVHDITDWESVDDDTYRQLWGWCQIQNCKGNRQYTIFRQEDVDIKRCVADYMAEIERQEKAAAERRAAAEKKRQMKAAAKQRLAEEQEIQLLNQLLTKHKDKIK